MTKRVSPWYNHTSWLGVKHQFTYLLTPCRIMEVLLNWIKESAGTSVSLPKSVGYGLGYSKKKWPLDFVITIGYTVLRQVHAQNIRYSEWEGSAERDLDRVRKIKKRRTERGCGVGEVGGGGDGGGIKGVTQLNQRTARFVKRLRWPRVLW